MHSNPFVIIFRKYYCSIRVMQKALFILILFSGCCFNVFAQNKTVKEILKYEFPVENSTVLHMSYASYKVDNAGVWSDSGKVITAVDLVFSKYPVLKEKWITNYDSLLKNRILSLQAIAPQLINNDQVKWNFILQTQCSTEPEAKKLFHGAVIQFKTAEPEKPVKVIPVVSRSVPVLRPSELPVNASLSDLVEGRVSFQDSIVVKVFERNQEWKNMVVISDWTGSMYEYGCQALRWHALNMDEKNVQMFFFFNDGDKKPDHAKKIGKTRGVYSCPGENISQVVQLMEKVKEKGDGGDIEENDLEAIVRSVKKTKGKAEYVLIADNKSHVRDLALINKIKVPVRVIVCGSHKGGVILPDYLELARSTGGSVHTMEEDIKNLSALKEGDVIEILSVPHCYRNGRFERLRTRQEEVF